MSLAEEWVLGTRESHLHSTEFHWDQAVVCLEGSLLGSRGTPPLPFVVWNSWHYCREEQMRRLADEDGGWDKLAAADICGNTRLGNSRARREERW